MKCEISYGEFFDKFTILVNKIYNCKDRSDVVNAMFQLMELSSCFSDQTRPGRPDLHQFILELRNVNKELWDLEDKVRVCTDRDLRLRVSDEIRELNAQRSRAKAAINGWYGDTQEIKDYATGTK